AVRSFALGVVLAATKPKNTILAFGSGVAASSAGLVGAEALVVLGVFLGAATVSIGAPVIAFLIAGERVNGGLERVRDWMIRHNSAMLGVILLFVGVVLVGIGLRGF
ncbi:MAG: GAP family protein, partial [Microcella sp.]|nr:GAP family protein [Microcella sp.]